MQNHTKMATELSVKFTFENENYFSPATIALLNELEIGFWKHLNIPTLKHPNKSTFVLFKLPQKP